MHELAVTQNIVNIAIGAAGEQGSARISRIKVKVGEMAGYVPEAIEFNFVHLAEGTPAEGATLEIEMVPLIVECSTCGEKSHVERFAVVICPKCQNFTVEIISGKELIVESIETE